MMREAPKKKLLYSLKNWQNLESSEGGARGAKYARVGDKVGSPPSPLVASLSV